MPRCLCPPYVFISSRSKPATLQLAIGKLKEILRCHCLVQTKEPESILFQMRPFGQYERAPGLCCHSLLSTKPQCTIWDDTICVQSSVPVLEVCDLVHEVCSLVQQGSRLSPFRLQFEQNILKPCKMKLIKLKKTSEKDIPPLSL